jgi:hypothetical protein
MKRTLGANLSIQRVAGRNHLPFVNAIADISISGPRPRKM